MRRILAVGLISFVFVGCGGSASGSSSPSSTSITPDSTTTTLNQMAAARTEYERINDSTRSLWEAVEAFQNENQLIEWSDFPAYCAALENAAAADARAFAAYKWPAEVSDEADAVAKSFARAAATASNCKSLPGTATAQARSSEDFVANDSSGFIAEFKLALGI